MASTPAMEVVAMQRNRTEIFLAPRAGRLSFVVCKCWHKNKSPVDAIEPPEWSNFLVTCIAKIGHPR